ncbi:MAG: CDP-diacylglycerol--serine O-phosphatidyltransferase [Bdellovibrionales bacterium RIFCSPHIGHO2_01_FULL_40_29]|nr:MAG: CDP-diacylglycerol--serine O-phosphatidyltransferase [Bdellovibrionales bacterium RIFCSPHIGHO2_01_FULL_40_29]OFZ35408.1 MAG: CDP-diacylglycerol--serine O-phosphatidyltransferase [Bdellovibrionales bacterium RIFCSPHIGHO2_02_FULL_40_15]
MADLNGQVEGYSKSGKRIGMYIYILPNLVTTANLFSGFYSIIYSIKGEFKIAAIAVVVAAIFDLLDGRLARLTHATSKFGAEYDSLCDLVSFGLAPSLLMFQWALNPFGRLGWLACFLFAACGALRLARFNVQVGVVEKNFFQGLPIPMAAGIVASAYLAFEDMGWDPLVEWQARGLLFMVMLLGIVMVSNFRYRSFKDLDLKERLPFKYLIMGVILLFIVAIRPELMLFILFFSYALLGAIFGILRLGKKQREIKASVYAPNETNETDLQEESEEDT